MDETEIQLIGSKIVTVLLHAAAAIEMVDLTDADLLFFELMLDKQVRDLANPMTPMVDPTYYRTLLYNEADIKMGLERVKLMRSLMRHWHYDKERLLKMAGKERTDGDHRE